ncbi:MAG: NUDIX hydrolase [Enhydrobacter sp.]|nr:NUDIX hydrolase [Enhydrobacter sp.]
MASQDRDKANPWIALRKETRFECPYFSVRVDSVSLGGGPERAYNSIRMKTYGVLTVPIDEEGCTTLIGQYRYVLDRYTWEVPGGGARSGLSDIDSAKAELSEETGLRADHWLQLFNASTSPGIADEFSPGFVAWGLHHGDPHPDPQERLSRRRVPFGAAIDMALAGEIASMSGIALLLSIHVRLQRGELPSPLAALLRT